MIDLLNIKLNGNYDFVQNTVPTSDGTWLCTEDITGYTKGFSYSISGDTITRIDTVKDFKLSSVLLSTIQNTCDFLNNFFYVRRQSNDITQYEAKYNSLTIKQDREFNYYLSTYGHYLFNSGTILGVQKDVFKTGDLIQLKGAQRNNYITYVTNSVGAILTIDNQNLFPTEEDCLIMLMDIPQSVQNIICQMLYYDVFTRGTVDNLQSESIGNYSYTKRQIQVGGLYYPPEITAGLESFKKVRFV